MLKARILLNTLITVAKLLPKNDSRACGSGHIYPSLLHFWLENIVEIYDCFDKLFYGEGLVCGCLQNDYAPCVNSLLFEKHIVITSVVITVGDGQKKPQSI